MFDRLVRVTTTDDPVAPVRVCSLLAQRATSTSSIQMVRQADGGWTIQICVFADSEPDFQLLLRRLERAVVVVSLDVVGDEPRQRRQSVFITLGPQEENSARVGEIARMFAAEVIALKAESMTVHLSASPDRCTQFVAVLDPYVITHVEWSAVSGTVREGLVNFRVSQPDYWSERV